MTHQEQQGDSVALTGGGGGGGKRTASNFGETGIKRIKTTHLHSVSPSHGGTEATTHTLNSCDEQLSQITHVSVSLDLGVSQLLDSRRAVLPVEVSPLVAHLDLNQAATAGALEANATTSKHPGIPVDLNIQDVTISANQGSTHLSQSGNSRDVSECGSTTGPATVKDKDKDPLTRWNEMKQNGFLSCPHHGLLPGAAVASSSQAKIPVPKQQPKKSKTRVLPKKMESTPQKKKKMESAKGEHADRFAKIAAPSGLLNGLNLGIINHVRNKKQVHSIIEALLRSETLGNGHSQHKQASHTKYVPKENMSPDDTVKHHLCPSHGIEGFSALSAGNNFTLPVPTGHSGSSMLDKISDRASVSHHAAIKDVESLRTEILSSAKACEESSTFSNEASTNTSSASLLSMRAANAAAQWLELLSQDIKGRISALRRSKKRVRSVMTTELPFLISKEFSTDQENVFCYTNGSSDGLPNNTLASMHLARWTKLFDQMDESLSEEEKQLESWLYDVREMQLQCDHGLQNFHLPGVVGSQHQGTLEYSKRNEQADRSTMELAVRAAAASIYSTCNFLMPKDNLSCF